MEILEGENATLPCDFTTLSSSPNLFWYRQYGNQNPERILIAYKSKSSNNHFQEGKFSTTLVLERNLLCHAKNPVQEPLLEAFNGRKTDLFCTHPNIQTNEYIFWYQQFPSQPPYFIVKGYQEPTKSILGERVSLVVAHNRKNSSLSFTNVAFEDQALYFCALGDTVSHPRTSQNESVSQTQSHMEILKGENATLP
ncbi:Immunoglobulin iota chain, partial [Ophiophagus hannah]